jgi:chromosome segregation ATPase
VEERDVLSQVALTNLNDQTIRLIFNSNVASPKVVEAIKRGQELKLKVAETQRELALAQQQLTDIERDQQRLRANLKETPPTAAAYKKYLAKLDAQEGEVDTLSAKIKELRQAGTQQQKSYDDYLANLSVE